MLLSFRGGTKEQRLVWFSRAGEKIGAVDGPATLFNPMVSPDRKRAQSRPSMRTVLSGEIDTESELDVPTFIRRHSATQQ